MGGLVHELLPSDEYALVADRGGLLMLQQQQ